jgi:hypothetical protein
MLAEESLSMLPPVFRLPLSVFCLLPSASVTFFFK